jgi:fructuronate reductase
VNIRTQAPPALTAKTLPDAKPALQRPRYDRERVEIGIVHFGPGAFHRAHQAFYVDELLAADPRWAISAVSLQSAGLRDALEPQDGLYTLAILDQPPTFRAIGAIKEVLVAPLAPEKVFARLTAPSTKVATITVTEKGYCLDASGTLNTAHPAIRHDLSSPQKPQSLIGYLVEGLRRRRADGAKPFAVISCDNLTDNGTRLRNAVIHFAKDIDRSLAAWIENEVAFPRTMVDSITPATDDALRERVCAATGLADAWPVQREAFTQWVIEDLPNLGPNWDRVGVTLTGNVAAYERAKLRLLNGAHSTLAYMGLLKGYGTVNEAMRDTVLGAFVKSLMLEDIAPTVRPPKELDIGAYVDDILTRFRNPAVHHQLSQIAWDGSQKLPFRLMGTIAENLIGGRRVDRLCLALAAWMHFTRRQLDAGRTLVDPLAPALARCAGVHADAATEVAQYLKLAEVFPAALTGSGEFRTRLTDAYASLRTP